MPETVLTDVSATAQKILNRLLAGGRVASAEPAAMGWIIRFEIADKAVAGLPGKLLTLEHSCDEFAKASRADPWLSDPDSVESVLRKAEDKIVDCVQVATDGGLSVLWDDGSAYRICPADYSMDWQWQITPGGEADPQSFSVVSVRDDKIWTRYSTTLGFGEKGA